MRPQRQCHASAWLAGVGFAVTAAITPGAPASATDVTNGGFETGNLTGWAAMAGTNAVVTSTAPHTGSYAAALSRRSASGAAGLTDSPDHFTQVPAGSVCTATAWAKGASGLRGTLKWIARSGTTQVSAVSKAITFTGSWQQFPTVTLTMPSGASTADLQLVAPSFPVGQTWYVDDVAASCAAGTPPPPVPSPGVVGHWAFDEPGPTPPQALDSSGNGNHGTNDNIQADGQAYTFNGTDSRVIVPDSDTLDPSAANFSFGVTLQLSRPPAIGETYDVLRKGVTTTTGGDYKLEIRYSNGKALARCVVKDAQKVAAIIAGGPNLADDVQHAVTCRRSGSSVSLIVDGATRATKTVAALGSVSNAAALAIGAKAEGTASTGSDWFLGQIYDAWVRIDP
jgi:Carbohydrate binding domain